MMKRMFVVLGLALAVTQCGSLAAGQDGFFIGSRDIDEPAGEIEPLCAEPTAANKLTNELLALTKATAKRMSLSELKQAVEKARAENAVQRKLQKAARLLSEVVEENPNTQQAEAARTALEGLSCRLGQQGHVSGGGVTPGVQVGRSNMLLWPPMSPASPTRIMPTTAAEFYDLPEVSLVDFEPETQIEETPAASEIRSVWIAGGTQFEPRPGAHWASSHPLTSPATSIPDFGVPTPSLDIDVNAVAKPVSISYFPRRWPPIFGGDLIWISQPDSGDALSLDHNSASRDPGIIYLR